MKILKTILAFILLVASASAQSFTQTGTFEYGGDITYTEQTIVQGGANTTQSVFAFSPFFGAMAVKGFELGLSPGLEIISQESSIVSKIANVYFAPSYNIDTHSNIYPYFEFLVGYNSQTTSVGGSYSGNPSYGYPGSYTSSGTGMGGEAGIKVAIKGCGLFLFKIQYLHQSFSGEVLVSNYYYPYQTSGTYSLNTVTFGMGFRLFSSTPGKVERPK